MKETIIISVGGSLIIPNEKINIDFLKKLNRFIRSHVTSGKRFLLVIGGGRIARDYRDAGKAVIGKITNEDLDWVGIHSTRLNAHLVRTIFQDIAHPRIIENYEKKLTDWKEPLAIAAGWKPGQSTDYCAVFLAKEYRPSLIINLSNIDWIYDKDPKKFKDAKKITKTTWDYFQKLVGTTWSPGSHAPFDPIASQLAKELGLTVIIANGNNLPNITKIISGDRFKGSIITPFRIDSSFYDKEYFEGRKKRSYIPYYKSPFFRSIGDLITNWYRALWIKFMINPKSCLDVGCGTGQLVSKLRILGIEAFGVEISKYALETAHKEIKPYLSLGDINHLAYDDNSFDLVCTYDVLEHVERSKLRQAFDETTRVSARWLIHKVMTRENILRKWLGEYDISPLSFLPHSFWIGMARANPAIIVAKKMFLQLPIYFETLLVLKKK